VTLRKHRSALIALAIYHFVFFFPVIFMGRVVSPNDVFYNYDPWSVFPHPAVQNSLINDPPTSYLTLMSLMKSGGEAFHWNPYIGSGVPGFGSSAAAVLSPFIALPVFALPLTWVYTGIILLKLNVAFWFAYFWLREERLGKPGAAIGAIVVAGAGIYAVRWLWQSTNATALYPAILWMIRRLWNGKRVPLWSAGLLALAYALAGFPAAMAYGAYAAILYAAFLGAQTRSVPYGRAVVALGGVVVALMIAAPSLVPFIQFVKRTGYLAMRDQASLQLFYPRSHWRAFVEPRILGDNAYKNWIGDPALGTLNNFVEATVYVGLAALPLILLAVANRRARSRWFWLAATIVVCGCMFGVGGFPYLIARLPGFKYSSLARMSMLLPLGAGYLAAAGAGLLRRILLRVRWRMVREGALIAIVIVTAFDLAEFAGKFYPFLTPEQATVNETPTITFLRSQRGPFRIAAFFNDLWPNSSELFELEDIRSHFSSEAMYRRILARIDPSSFGSASTVLRFDSLKFRLADPFVGMLGVRYLLEQRSIDIVRWSIYANTVPGVKDIGALKVPSRRVIQRTIRIDAEPFYAIELPVSLEEPRPHSRLVVTLLKNGNVVYTRAFTPGDVAVMSKIYIPLRPHARLGEVVQLRVQPVGTVASLLGSGPAPAGESPFFYGRVKLPVIFDRELVDGRIFRNVAEVPRFRSSAAVRRLSVDDLLQTTDIDFERESVISDPSVPLPSTAATARVALTRYLPAEQELATESAQPFFLASSEKLTPELRITIDGKPASAVPINLMFAGAQVPAGKHVVLFERRLARGIWWPLSALGALLLAVSAALRR
jgi:hypothetical protein